MEFIKTITKSLIYVSIFISFVIFCPGLSPTSTTFSYKKYEIAPSMPLEGVLKLNNLLDNTEHLFKGDFVGPEHLIVHDGNIFTGITGGDLIKLTGPNSFEYIVKTGKPCKVTVDEATCGRILGIGLDTIEKNSFIIMDAYHGIFHYNLDTKKKTQLIGPESVLDGEIPRPAKLFNSVAVAQNGDLYWTDSSSEFPLNEGFHTLFTNGHGRLFHYNRSTKTNKMLVDHINFANGLVLSPREEFVVFSETNSARIMKHYLTGSKKGQLEIFVDQLPGLPDNLTPDTDGIWAPLVSARDEDTPYLIEKLASKPWLRKTISSLVLAFEAPFLVFERFFPNPFTAELTHLIGSFQMPGLQPSPRATVLKINWEGGIVKALHSKDGLSKGISSVLPYGDYLYFGSPWTPYLMRKRLPDLN